MSINNSFFRNILARTVCFAALISLILSSCQLYKKEKNVIADSKLYIPTGANFQQVLDSIKPLIKDVETFKKSAEKMKLRRIYPGRYTLIKDETNEAIINRLLLGKQDEIQITVGNYASIYELADEKQLVLALKETKNKNVLGDRGYLLSVNLGSGKTVWEKKIGNFDITFTQDYIVYKSFDGYKIFEKRTGKFLYTEPDEIGYVDQQRNFAITQDAKHFDLQTHKSNWYRKVPGSWEDVSWLNDSVFVVAANGLYGVHLRDGMGWDYKLNSGFNKSRAYTYKPVKLFGLGNYGWYNLNSPTSSKKFGSNILLDSVSGTIAYVSNNEMIYLDNEGNKKWKNNLYKSETGILDLIDLGTSILSVNTGLIMGVKGMMTAYDIHNGLEVYHIELDPKGNIRSYLINHDEMLIVTEKALFKYNLKTGILLSKKEDKRYNNLRLLKTEACYKKDEDGKFVSLDSISEGKFAAILADDVFVFDEKLEKSQSWKSIEFWALRHVYNDILVLKNRKEIILVKEGVSRARLQLTGATKVVDGKLLIMKDSQLSIVDLVSLAI